MAITTFWIFEFELNKIDPVFWFIVQVAMLAGFGTAHPVNRWLLQKKIKEPMEQGRPPYSPSPGR